MKKNYYEILEINKDASEEEIRKAYLKLVKIHHPDKGGSQEKFEEILHVYETLKDPEKRQIYDIYGEEGLNINTKKNNYDNNENYKNDFEHYDFNFKTTQKPPNYNEKTKTVKIKKKKCKTKYIQIKITLEEVYFGLMKNITYNKQILCPKCNGSGSDDPNENTDCLTCKGYGFRLFKEKNGNNILRKTCDKCLGLGVIIKNKCSNCDGYRIKNMDIESEILIEKGIENGHRTILKNKGDEYPKFENGDLIITFYIEDNKIFIRKENDIVYHYKINLIESLLGNDIIIKNYINGNDILIENKKIIKFNDIKIVNGLGMPIYKEEGKYGNLIIKFIIEIPKDINKEQIEQFDKIFNFDNIENKTDDSNEDIEEFFMENYDENEINSNFMGGKEENYFYEEEEEEKETI